MASFKKIDPQSGGGVGIKVYKINIVAADVTDNSEVDVGGDIDAGDIVFDAYVDVNTAEATATTKTIDVGLLASESGGDADGLIDGISVAATGVVYPTLASGGQTVGALLRADESGAGVLVPEPHSSDSVTAKSVSVSFGDAGGANELDVDIYILARAATVVG